MNIEQTRMFLTEISKTGSILGMESITRLCHKLGNPQDKVKTIHIAGTNGKGSTGRFIETALLTEGYKVGRYCSPAVFAYEEIFKINDQMISEERLAQLMTEVRQACLEIERQGNPMPTVFEVETAAAFLYFYQENCDIAIIEVGMGGLEDATNVIKQPILSVITSISMDHMQFLGNSLEEIARAKAGIIKENSPVVALWQKDEVNRVLNEKVKPGQLIFANSGELSIVSSDLNKTMVECDKYGQFFIGMCGSFQLDNLACAIKSIEILCDNGCIKECEWSKIFKAWENVTWPGRFERILNQPVCVIDGCHNADAAQKLAVALAETMPKYKKHFVIGVLSDKEYEEIFKQVLPLGISADCITPNNKRGLDKQVLTQVASKYLSDVKAHDTVQEAMDYAFGRCNEPLDAVVVFGSLSYLGEVKHYVDEIRR